MVKMKLPDHLCNTYARYKQSQEVVLSYLVKTANNTAQNSSDSTTNVNLDTMTLRDLAKAAEAVACALKPNKPPVSILESLSEVIDLRERCLTWFKSNTHQDDAGTRTLNDKHAHIIDILKIVSLTLGGKDYKLVSEKNAEDKEGVETSFTNTFAALHLYETLAEAPSQTTAFELREKKDAKERYNVVRRSVLEARFAEQKEQEYILARFCLLEDQQAMVDELFLRMCSAATTGESWLSIAPLADFIIDHAIVTELDMHKSVEDWTRMSKMFHCRLVHPRGTNQCDILRMQAVIFERLKYSIISRLNSGKISSLSFVKFTPDMDITDAPRHQIALARKKYGIEDPCLSSNSDISLYFRSSAADKVCLEAQYVANLLKSSADEDIVFLKTSYIDRVTKCAINLLSTNSVNYLLDEDGAAYLVPSYVALSFHIGILAEIILGRETIHGKVPAASQMQHTATSITVAASRHMGMLIEPSHGMHASPQSLLFRCYRQWSITLDASTRAIQAAKAAPARSNRGMLSYIGSTFGLNFNYMTTTLGMIDNTGVLAMLGLMWQLFKLEGIDMPEWPDLQFILKELGEDFVFHGTRPTSTARLNASGCHMQGLATSRVKEQLLADGLADFEGHLAVSDDRTRRFYVEKKPLSSFLHANMLAPKTTSHNSGAVVPELLVYGGPMQKLANKETVNPQFHLKEECIDLHDRTRFWKVKDKSPKLTAAELISLLAREVKHEMVLCTFDWLKFEEALNKLVDVVDRALQDPKCMAAYGTQTVSTWKIRGAVGTLISDVQASPGSWLGKVHKTRVEAVRPIFSEWLTKNGSLGLTSTGVFRMQKSTLTQLSPDVVSHVQDVVKRRGLQEGIFTPDQCKEMGIEVTYNLEDRIKEKWQNFRKPR